MASDIDRRQLTGNLPGWRSQRPCGRPGNCPAKNYWPASATPCGYPSTTSCGPGSILSATASKRGRHFVTTFIEHLSGVDFAKREIVKIRNRYEASVPTVVGAVERQKPVFVEDARYLRQLTSQPIKWALPGPMTMIDTLYDNHYKSREKLAWEFAKILNQEAKELRRLRGLILFSSMSRPLTSSSMRSTTGGSPPRNEPPKGWSVRQRCISATAMASRPIPTGKKTLASEWRQYEEAFPQLQKSSLDIISRVPQPRACRWICWS